MSNLFRQYTYVYGPKGSVDHTSHTYFIHDADSIEEYLSSIDEALCREGYTDWQENPFDYDMYPVEHPGKYERDGYRGYDGYCAEYTHYDAVDIVGEITEEEILILKKFKIV